MLKNAPQQRAYFAPFLAFLAFLLLRDIVAGLAGTHSAWALAAPQYWIFPLQTAVCGALIWRCRRHYEFRPLTGIATAVAAGLLAFGIWVSPQAIFHFPPRLDGFQPGFFGESGWPHAATLTFRLARMIIVVPLVEEIFWRGFLLRYFVNQDFGKVPFGTFAWRSFFITTFAFCLVHRLADWPAAAFTGALYNLVAYRTRSLFACVLTHAVTNLALAGYILLTRQWGFW